MTHKAMRGPARPGNVNIIESTVPKDRPTEAVAQLRDIAGWLRAEGYHFMADYTDDVADSIAHAYEV